MPAAAPGRKASELTVDQWNDAMRASPLYQDFVRRHGLVGKKGGWSRSQQAAWERELAAHGVPIPDGMHIDQGGNLNQKNRLGRNAIITGAVAAAALATFGAAGMGPLGGVMGGGGAAAGTTAAGTTAAGATAAGTTAATTATTAATTGAGLWAGLKKGLGKLGPRDWLDLAIFGGQSMADFWSARNMANASDRAAEIEAQSAREALALLREQWEQSRKDFAPYLEAGQAAIGQISSNMRGQSPRALPVSVESRLGGRPGAPGTMGSFGKAPVIDLSQQAPGVWGKQPVTDRSTDERVRPGQMLPPEGLFDLGLPPGVPPGSVPVNGGINPNAWAYQTPDGRIVRGTRNPEQVQQMSAFGDGPQVSTVKMQIKPGIIKDVPASYVQVWQARGATPVGQGA